MKEQVLAIINRLKTDYLEQAERCRKSGDEEGRKRNEKANEALLRAKTEIEQLQ